MFSSGTSWNVTVTSRLTISGHGWRLTTSSMKIIPVTEDLRENFPSILGAESPFIPEITLSTVSYLTCPTFLQDESSQPVFRLSPNYEHICYGGVGNPVLAAGQPPDLALLIVLGPRLHVCRVWAVVWLRKTEASDDLSPCQSGQVFLSLSLAPCTIPWFTRYSGGTHKQGVLVNSASLDALEYKCTVFY